MGWPSQLPPSVSFSGNVLRVPYFKVGNIHDLSANAAREYSRMKYGDPDATHSIAERLCHQLVDSPEFLELVPPSRKLLLASSAYGSIPTAAFALAREMKDLLGQEGFEVAMVKFERSGGFSRTDYGALDYDERLKALKKRRIGISAEDRALLKDATLLVVDDLRSTGAHERVLLDLLQADTEVASVAFAYWISFEDELQTLHPMEEESINHSNIACLEDLLPFFSDRHVPPYLNSRVLKFILLGGKPGKDKETGQGLEALAKFLLAVPMETCRRMYEAALSRDGYHSRERFLPGLQVLEQRLVVGGAMDENEAKRLRRAALGNTVLHTIGTDGDGQYVCLDSGKDLREDLLRYSRFKFGGINEIRYFGKALADRMVEEIAGGGRMADVFARARSQNEYIYLQAPGYRNVVSASNFLLREVAARVNVWLGLRGLPTMIVKPLTRLASGRANYAQLSAEERNSRSKSTQSLIPARDYRDHPIHVIFLDDVEVTGATAHRARKLCLKAGAISFQAVFIFQVDPGLAQSGADIEHKMNQFRVGGHLDDEVASILAHPEYQPVQRMLRLLLHPSNRASLADFARNRIPPHSLLRVYEAALANDYLWINPEGGSSQEGQIHGEYGPSVVLLRELMREEGLLDDEGMPV